MVRALSALLHVALAATVVNAQIGDFIKSTFGGAVAQIPLSGAVPESLVAKHIKPVTYDNWLRTITNVTADPSAGPEDVQEWVLYFTKAATEGEPQAVGPRNISFWNSVYNVRPSASD